MDSSALPACAPPVVEEHRSLPPGLLALAVGGFGIGLTEFVISGLLSEVARDLHVGVPAAGALVWGYALAVVVGAFTVTAALTRRPPRAALLVLLGLFVVGNAATAAAPDFTVAVAGRVVTALCHGGFFGIGAVLAGDLVPVHRRASAVAVMFGGLTLANVLGVPFGTFVGQQLGWRAAFWCIAAIGVVAMAGVRLLVPRRPAPPTAGSHLGVLLRPQVIVSMLLTMTMFGGLFGAFIYVEPLVRHVTGFSETAVPWLLVVFGVGLFAGNLLGGRAADRSLTTTFRVLAVLLPLVLVAYALTASWRPAVVVLLLAMGLVGFAATPALQVRVMQFAGDAPTMASAANIAAFNLGNAIGSALGGLTIALGLGWRSPVWVGAAMALAGSVLVFSTTHEADR
ncbi:MFS transporter [Nocardioides mangrovicus]|uniref:MFS transporter n=1 Tax=Nocardioides mangrovicus TaxID=2478913 RepID=A0A3L8P165_9ACTN|nr:MFS transporter [Nocardioides mangrovicus]RLV48677.1 MFS transporter [Nocardioides mangrovicus]